MALDTSNFSFDKKAGDGYKALRTALQAAFKDINDVLQPKPKLNPIMATDQMGQVVVAQIAQVVGTDDDGNPKWTDDRAGNLKPETVELYTWLADQQQPEQEQPPAEPGEGATDATATEPAEAAAATAATTEDAAGAETAYLTDNEECPGWLHKQGPKEGEEACGICSRNEACAKHSGIKQKPSTKKAAPSAAARSRYGQRLNTMSAEIDDLIWAGCTKESATKVLMEKYGRDEKRALAKFTGHVKRLQKDGLVVNVSENGFYKAQSEYFPN